MQERTKQEHNVPSREEVHSYLRDRRNWERWGTDDQKGAINLITPEKRVAAARLVRSGRAVSLSRDWPKQPGPGNPRPAEHLMISSNGPRGGFSMDYYGIRYHGFATTHIDALCHVWDEHGMWGGRNPAEAITFQGARWGDISQWSEGIVTRGVLLDVPRHRREESVSLERPVHGWELEEICRAQGVTVESGDALLVYSGRERYAAAHPAWDGGRGPNPGLHASCLPFLRDHDVAVLVWDQMEASPNDYDMPFPVHAALHAFGVALLDNALVEPLAEACQAEGRYEFMLTIAPLVVRGGTGSPVNPLALF